MANKRARGEGISDLRIVSLRDHMDRLAIDGWNVWTSPDGLEGSACHLFPNLIIQTFCLRKAPRTAAIGFTMRIVSDKPLPKQEVYLRVFNALEKEGFLITEEFDTGVDYRFSAEKNGVMVSMDLSYLPDKVGIPKFGLLL